MTRAEMDALIARVEAAEGPDRELDAEIGRARGYVVAETATWGAVFVAAGRSEDGSPRRVPTYTASLDAAAALVPSGWRWMLDNLNTAGPLAMCEHWPATGPTLPYTRGEAATPALALTAAALRARQAMQMEGEG